VTPITPTPTPVPGVPPGCVDLIVNGGFELDTAWQFGDSPSPAQYVGNVKYAGMRSMQLGNPPRLSSGFPVVLVGATVGHGASLGDHCLLALVAFFPH
jgi:hypothetical protein